MKKVSIASLLVASAFAVNPGMLSHTGVALGQTTAAGGQVQLDPAEFTDYDNAVNKQTTPATQIPALEAFLVKYPKSAVKADVQTRLMIDYSTTDPAKAIDAADKVLQLTPNNLQAYIIEVAFRAQAAQTATDPGTKQTGLDSAADFATRGLAVNTKLAGLSDADFAAQKAYATPIFYGAMANDALAKKDYSGAITNYKAELAAEKPEDTTKPAALQDTFFLGQAYELSTPPDFLNCAYYTTRAAALAPDQFKPQLQPLATYCYKKYHGGADGYDAVVTAASANLNPPSGFSVTPAPTNADIVKKTLADTPDLSALAIDDREFIIQYGTPDEADKVFAPVKGKTTDSTEAIFVSGTPDKIMVSVGSEAIQNKTADFTYNMKTPLKTVPAAGAKLMLSGTYSSYVQSPVMIVMDNGEEAKPAAKKPAATRRR